MILLVSKCKVKNLNRFCARLQSPMNPKSQWSLKKFGLRLQRKAKSESKSLPMLSAIQMFTDSMDATPKEASPVSLDMKLQGLLRVSAKVSPE